MGWNKVFGYLRNGIFKLYYIALGLSASKQVNALSGYPQRVVYGYRRILFRFAIALHMTTVALHHAIRCKVLECRYVLAKEEIPVEFRIVQVIHIPVFATAGC